MSRVSVAEAKSKVGIKYQQGCSGLTADLLNRPWKGADQYIRGAYIGANGSYSGVAPGDIIGFPGHVGVYIGEVGCKFIDVPGPGGICRKLVNGYGAQAVYKYSY